jgi:propanediol dehydratase large subunit
VILPAYNTPIRCTRSTNDPSQQTHQTQTRHPSTIREVISAQIEDIIQSALGIDDEKTDIDVLRASTASPITLAPGSSLGNVGLPVDIELGDMGLRHRSADSMAENKKGLQQGLLTDA